MADITKKVDTHIDGNKKYQYWSSSENADDGTAIAQGDVFKIRDSLGKPAHYLYIETGVGCDLEIRLNSQVTFIPGHRRAAKNAEGGRDRGSWPPGLPAIDEAITYTDDTMEAIPIGANEVWELEGVLAIDDIQIASWSTGSFALVVV